MQEFGGEVGPIGPDQRVELGIKPELPEIVWVTKRLEDPTVQLARQVHLAAAPVSKAEPNHVVSYVA